MTRKFGLAVRRHLGASTKRFGDAVSMRRARCGRVRFRTRRPRSTVIGRKPNAMRLRKSIRTLRGSGGPHPDVKTSSGWTAAEGGRRRATSSGTPPPHQPPSCQARRCTTGPSTNVKHHSEPAGSRYALCHRRRERCRGTRGRRIGRRQPIIGGRQGSRREPVARCWPGTRSPSKPAWSWPRPTRNPSCVWPMCRRRSSTPSTPWTAATTRTSVTCGLAEPPTSTPPSRRRPTGSS